MIFDYGISTLATLMLKNYLLCEIVDCLWIKLLGLFNDVLFDYSSCKLGKRKTVFSLTWWHSNWMLWFNSREHLGHCTHYFTFLISNVVIFIDNYRKFIRFYFLHAKSEIFDAFKISHSLIENQFSKSIKISCTHYWRFFFFVAIPRHDLSRTMWPYLYTPQPNRFA